MPLASLLARNGDLRRLLLAQLLVYAADSFPVVPLLLLLSDLTGGELWGAVTLAVGAAVLALVLPFAGAITDRRSRRAVLLTATVVMMAAVLALTAVRSPAAVWLAPVAIGVISAAKAFYVPAVQAALPNLVAPADLRTANAAAGCVWGTAFVLGASLGGVFTAVAGPYPCFLAMAVALAAAAALTRRIRRPMGLPVPAGEVRGNLTAIAASLRYIAGHRWVSALVTVKSAVNIGSSMIVVFPVLAIDVLGGGAVANGLLFAARGAGVVIGPLLVAPFVLSAARPRATAVLALLMAIYGLACLGIAFSPSLAIALVLVTIAHAASGGSWMTSTMALQTEVPDGLRGRVFATDMMLAMITVSASQLLAGALVGHLGVRAVIAGCGAVTLAYVLVWAVGTSRDRVPVVRRQPVTPG